MTYHRYSNLAGYRRPPQSPTPRSSGSRSKKYAIVAALLILAGGGLKAGLHIKAVDHAAALAAIVHRQQQQAAFSRVAGNLISGNPAITFSVSAIDLNSGTAQNFGNAQPMEAASVGKLLTASLFLHQTEIGQANLKEQIDGHTAQHELQELINQSDDTAWQALNDQLGHSALAAYAGRLGLDSYQPSDNTISAQDVAKLLKKLYLGSLLNNSDTHLLLSFMRNTNYEDFMAPAVRPGGTIYDKVGLVNDDVNDAAIITDGQKSLILVVFSDGHGTENWNDRVQMIQELARAAQTAYFD